MDPAGARALFDLGFGVEHVLANDRIVLLHCQFIRRVALVLVGRVVVAGTRAGDQFDFISHDDSLAVLDGIGSDLLSASANVGEHRIDTLLVDYPHTMGRDFQPDEALFAVNPEAMKMQVG